MNNLANTKFYYTSKNTNILLFDWFSETKPYFYARKAF